MKASIPPESGPALSPEQQRSGQHYLVRLSVVFGCTNALVWSVSSLFLLSLGVMPFHLGLMETAMQLTMTVRRLAARMIVHIGKTRLMFFGLIGMLLPLSFLVALALHDDGNRTSL